MNKYKELKIAIENFPIGCHVRNNIFFGKKDIFEITGYVFPYHVEYADPVVLVTRNIYGFDSSGCSNPNRICLSQRHCYRVDKNDRKIHTDTGK